MKKDQKFLNELNEKLGNMNTKKKDAILLKYKNIIEEEKKNGKKITVIIKSFGNIEEIAKKEIELNKKSDLSFKIKNIFNKKSKDKGKKSKIKEFEDKINDFDDKFNLMFKKKMKTQKIKNNIETVKGKIEKDTKNISNNIKEASSELKENIKNEISIISSVPADKKLFETKKERKHRMFIEVLKVLVVIILLFLWLWASIAFIAGLFAILDGIKIYGINIILFSLMLLTLWALLLVNRTLFRKKMDKMIWFISLLVILFILGFGIALTAYKMSKIDTVKDVSDKYNFTRKYEEYNLPQNESKKFYIYFNSNYKTKYELEYNESMNGKIGVEVKYYECYYNFYNKKSNHNVYISLKQDYRDKLSVYIENLKENKIYDSDELSRYTVKITGNKKDLERVVIN